MVRTTTNDTVADSQPVDRAARRHVAAAIRGIRPIPSPWDLSRDGVTPGLLLGFVDCRERCRLRFTEGLSDRFSTIVSNVESGLNWLMWQSNIAPSWNHQQLLSSYDDTWNADRQDPIDRELYQHQTVQTFLRAILDTQGPQLLDIQAHDWGDNVQDVRVPWVVPDTMETSLRRRLIVEQDEHGVVLHEARVCRQGEPEDFRVGLSSDLKTIIGLLMLRNIVGDTPLTVKYHVIQLNACRRTQDDPEEFYDYVMRWIAYQRQWFTTVTRAVAAQELAVWERTLLSPILEDLHDWHLGGHHYPNLASLQKWSGFYPAIVEGDYSGCYRRRELFSELEW